MAALPRRLAAGLLLTSACLDSSAFFDDDVPLNLEHVVALTATEEGAIRRVSSLQPASDPPPILKEAGELAWFMGWDASLAEAGLDLAELSSSALIPAPDCRVGLPEPIWAIEISDDRGQGPIAPERIPSLSHPSISGVCPSTGVLRPESEKPADLLANTSIRNTCRADYCSGGLEQLEDCQIRVDLGRCVGQEQTGFIDRFGGLCIEENLGCRNTHPTAGAVLSVICDIGPQECRFDFYQPERALDLEVEKVRLAPPLSAELAAGLPNRVPLHASHSGMISDLAVGQDRVVAVARAEAILSTGCEGETVPAKLATLGGTSLSVLSESEPQLPCLSLLAMGDADELFGVYGIYPDLFFVRFDSNGVVAQTRPIPSSTPREPRAFFPVDLVYEPESQKLVLGLHTEAPSGADRLVIATPDLRSVETTTLSQTHISTIRLGRNVAGDSRLVIAEATKSLALWWRPGQPMEESSAGLISPGVRVMLLAAEPFGRGNVIGLFAGDTPSMNRARYGTIGAFDTFWFYEAVTDGTALVEFESADESSRRVFVAGRERGSGVLGRAMIAEYRDEPPRFLEAGARVIGEGVVAGGRRDASGDAWLVLPWAGEVVRIGASAAP